MTGKGLEARKLNSLWPKKHRIVSNSYPHRNVCGRHKALQSSVANEIRLKDKPQSSTLRRFDTSERWQTLATETYEQMFRSGSQSEAKPPVFNSQKACNTSNGSGSQVVEVSDHAWPCHEFEPSTTKTRRVGQRCTLNLSRAETSSCWCGVIGQKQGRSYSRISRINDTGSPQVIGAPTRKTALQLTGLSYRKWGSKGILIQGPLRTIYAQWSETRKKMLKTTSGCFYPRSNHWEKLEEGRSVTSVAAEIGIAHSIVSRLWRQFQTTRTVIRGFSSGRPRGTTPADDRYIVLQARRNRRQTAGEIARHTTQATGRPISRFTVARRLNGGGLFARRPVRCVPLTPAHRRRRSLWCREHRNWRDNEWGRVLFTDESRFSLSSDSHRILIWRERGSRNHPSNIIERDRYGGRGVLVWGGIMLGSRTDLHIFDAGSVNGIRYCNEILLPYVRLFRGAMGLQFLFMDDNAPCHRTVAVEQLLESEDIERMDWAARSPDLNPIEHVWDFLGRRLAISNDSGASIGAARRMGSNASTTH
ncbi:transposable element Tc1 transposase [Trichonephila clavipes]|nr:transposable element Tc1 transposase [Trichonephila clavipes]